jgi:hypothetical protein
MFARLLRLVALGVFGGLLALPAPAAPVIKSGGPGLNLEKYLLDDADGVLVVNVKLIAESPGYKKGLQKQLADLVARPEVQEYLKDTGFDPLKDVERVVFCMSRSCMRGDGETNSDNGPFMLFQGKFDAAKLKAKMADLVKLHPDIVSSSDAPGGQKVYRIDPRRGPYAAQLDAGTIVMAGCKAHVLDALLKASGKKTTKLAHKEAQAHLKKLKTDVALQGFALESMVYNTTYTTVDNGMGQRTFKAQHTTLGEKGFKEATLTVKVKDIAEGNITWQVKSTDKVKALKEEFTKGLADVTASTRRVAEREPRLAALARFFEGATIKSVGPTITMEGKADPEMVQALFLGLFR